MECSAYQASRTGKPIFIFMPTAMLAEASYFSMILNYHKKRIEMSQNYYMQLLFLLRGGMFLARLFEFLKIVKVPIFGHFQVNKVEKVNQNLQSENQRLRLKKVSSKIQSSVQGIVFYCSLDFIKGILRICSSFTPHDVRTLMIRSQVRDISSQVLPSKGF